MRDLWKDWIPDPDPYKPARGWDETVVHAFRALADGAASDHQQQLVWKWIQYLTSCGDFQDMSFRPGGADGERMTAFAEGKRFVGLQLLKLLHPATLEAVERERVAREKQTRGKSK